MRTEATHKAIVMFFLPPGLSLRCCLPLTDANTPSILIQVDALFQAV